MTNRDDLTITVCPNCGSPSIRHVREDWKGSWQGKPYTVKALGYYACPTCQEKVYPPEAMRRIQQASPAYAQRHAEPQPSKATVGPGAGVPTR